MWTLIDNELKQKLSTWFTDEEIDKECCQQMHTITPGISLRKNLSPAAGSVAFDISKHEFKLVYNPNGWNPYPQVRPPEVGKWLVQDKHGNIEVRDYLQDYGPEGCEDWWTKTPSCRDDVVAFMALPKPYTIK